MQRPTYLAAEAPLDALCHHFNVRPTTAQTATVGPTFDMPATRDAHMPTHVLAATQPDYQSYMCPTMLPINLNLFEQGFRVELNFPPAIPGSTAPIPRSTTDGLVVTLPVIPITVPHVGSLALLLLYGMNLETNHNTLAWKLLPVNVVEEFPNAAAMALILSNYRDDIFDNTYRHNQGLWRNILSVSLTNNAIMELVQTAWNVTAEARRIRQRSRQ